MPPEQLLGTGNIPITETYYHDFIGFSPHGEFFDFQELTAEGTIPQALFQTARFKQAPDYNPLRTFYRQKLANPASATWQATPVEPKDSAVFQQVLRYGNLLDDKHSNHFLTHNYLTTPGNFYAYFSGYPAGTILYCLLPAENKIFIIRLRG